MEKERAVQFLITLELQDSDAEETKMRGKTREWLKGRDQLGYFNNIIQELRMKDTGRFKERSVFNYRHSRAQRISENFFLILANR